MAQPGSKPAAGTFRTRLQITSRSGWMSREYRLQLLPGRVRVSYAVGRMSYDIAFDPEVGEVVCSCPAFEADGGCKHRDALLALLDGLSRCLSPEGIPAPEEKSGDPGCV